MTVAKTKVKAAQAHPYGGKVYAIGETYLAEDEYIPTLRALGFIESRGEDVKVADEPEADKEPAKDAEKPAKYQRRDMQAGK